MFSFIDFYIYNKNMKNIKTVNEYFELGGIPNLDKNPKLEYTEEEKTFIKYLYNYSFKNVIKTFETIPSKILGITYKKRTEENEKEISYNDFSLYKKTEDGILFDSGANGTYRPEGYFWGSKEADNTIKIRLEKLVSAFNKSYGKNLTVTKKEYLIVSGF